MPLLASALRCVYMVCVTSVSGNSMVILSSARVSCAPFLWRSSSYSRPSLQSESQQGWMSSTGERKGPGNSHCGPRWCTVCVCVHSCACDWMHVGVRDRWWQGGGSLKQYAPYTNPGGGVLTRLPPCELLSVWASCSFTTSPIWTSNGDIKEAKALPACSEFHTRGRCCLGSLIIHIT